MAKRRFDPILSARPDSPRFGRFRLVDISDFVYERCGLLSAKGGLMMGTKKVGAFPSPHKKANFIIALEKQK
jgi:hypothetical protein